MKIPFFFRKALSKRGEGKKGEERAKKFLEDRGYKILFQNYRTRCGEIDLICEEGETLVFVEVRQKRGGKFGTPIESIDQRKIEKIKKTAEIFLSEKGIFNREIRFDFLAISGEKIELITDAF